MMRKTFLSLLFFFAAWPLWAQETQWVNNKGLSGEEFVSIAVCPFDHSLVLLGTDKGLYQNNEQLTSWQPVCDKIGNLGRINQILFDEFSKSVYVATDKGLYLFDDTAKNCQKIFEKSSEKEKKCLAVCAAKDGTLYVGTKGGLFIKRNNQWTKESSLFDEKNIVALQSAGNRIYVATDTSIYTFEKKAKQWQKIFNIYAFAEPQESAESSSDENGDQEESPIRQMAVSQRENESCVYAATSKGVFMSKDQGKTWERLPLAGLDYVHLRYLLFDPKTGAVYAVAKSGLYALENAGWTLLFAAHDSRMAAFKGDGIILISGSDIFRYSPMRSHSGLVPHENKGDHSLTFKNEPTIREVQKMAIVYCEVGNEKIQDWRRRAQWKAFLPELDIDYDKTVTTALGASYDRTQVGPRDWGVSLKWDLADFIYSSDQTSIDTRSKLMVELRNDILAEVTRLYFERRKLQMELLTRNTPPGKDDLDKKLRIAELEALIDRLTGGNFSESIKVLKH